MKRKTKNKFVTQCNYSVKMIFFFTLKKKIFVESNCEVRGFGLTGVGGRSKRGPTHFNALKNASC